MTIQEIAAKLNRYDDFPEAELPECFACYNAALNDIEAGELGDAKKNLKKALRENPEFDDGNMLLSLVLFAMGNRIECMRRINEINDAEKHDLAMDYVDSLSSNGRRRQKAVESETDEERQKRVEEETFSVSVDVAKPGESFNEPQPSKNTPENDENFKKRYRKAKKARDEELQSTDADATDETSLAATRISAAPSAATVVVSGPKENPPEDVPYVKEAEPETPEEPAIVDNGEPTADEQPEPEEPVTLVFDFEKMFDTGYTERKNTETTHVEEEPCVSSVKDEAAEPEAGADSEPESDSDEKYVNDELTKPESRLKAVLKVAAAVAALALIALIAFKLSL